MITVGDPVYSTVSSSTQLRGEFAVFLLLSRTTRQLSEKSRTVTIPRLRFVVLSYHRNVDLKMIKFNQFY